MKHLICSWYIRSIAAPAAGNLWAGVILNSTFVFKVKATRVSRSSRQRVGFLFFHFLFICSFVFGYGKIRKRLIRKCRLFISLWFNHFFIKNYTSILFSFKKGMFISCTSPFKVCLKVLFIHIGTLTLQSSVHTLNSDDPEAAISRQDEEMTRSGNSINEVEYHFRL